MRTLSFATDKAAWEDLGPALCPSSTLPHRSGNPQTSPCSMQPGDIEKSWQRPALCYTGHRESAGTHSPVHGAQKCHLRSGRSLCPVSRGAGGSQGQAGNLQEMFPLELYCTVTIYSQQCLGQITKFHRWSCSHVLGYNVAWKSLGPLPWGSRSWRGWSRLRFQFLWVHNCSKRVMNNPTQQKSQCPSWLVKKFHVSHSQTSTFSAGSPHPHKDLGLCWSSLWLAAASESTLHATLDLLSQVWQSKTSLEKLLGGKVTHNRGPLIDGRK